MKNLTKALLAAGVLSFAATGFAAQPASFGPGVQGFYAGADAGFGSTSCSACSVSATGTGSTSNSGFAGTVFGGYQFNQFFALEAGWGMLPAVKTTVNILGISDDTTSSATHFYGAVKGMYPIDTQWGVFGKVGYDSMNIDSNDNVDSTASGVLLAAGASYAVNSNIALTAAYNQILDSSSGTNMNVGYATVGLNYLF